MSIPPSHCRNIKPPTLLATSSIRDALQRSFHASSGVPGPGYYSAIMIEWLGKNCIHGIENVIIFKRCLQYQYLLRRWEGYKGGAANRRREKQFFDMLGDLLELSRSVLETHSTRCLIISTARECYSSRVKKRALSLAERANQLALKPVSRRHKEDALTWRACSMLCFVPM